jgi:xanthine dehydrogenase small subunit
VRLLLQLTDTLRPPPTIQLRVDGVDVEVPDDGASLLDVLRDLGRRSPKDGCSPQGQCGCCTVWVDGSARVACVTPARRVAGRSVTTAEGLDPGVRDGWAQAFSDTGASQCGFCTPGIIMRLAALAERRPGFDDDDVDRALAAHLCRCTGWLAMHDAARRAGRPGGGDDAGRERRGSVAARDLGAAAQRAALEGGVPQAVGPEIALGGGGFAEDSAPADALVAVPDGRGSWSVAETLRAARAAAGKVQGRNSTVALRHPLELPPGDWALTLRTTFVEPAYLEPDASWCEPGGAPASPLANGGAFGGKLASGVGEVARRLADEHGRCVRVVLAREDVVRLGPKRPPIAAGVAADGTGVVRVARTPGAMGLDEWAAALRRAAPGLAVEEVGVPGPPVSAAIRAAGWAEGAVLMAALAQLGRDGVGPGIPVTVVSPLGASATATVAADGALLVALDAGAVLDEVVLRSYATGAAHQALGWVRSEGVAVDESGTVLDLTIRSYGILPAREMPPVEVVLDEGPGPAVPGGDAVFAAVAAATWLAHGLGPSWPVDRGGTT